MDIDVTELTSWEIIDILTNYPRGRLVIKHERIFWESGSVEPVSRPSADPGNYPGPPRPNAGNKLASGFQAAADTLGSMVCMPQPRPLPPR